MYKEKPDFRDILTRILAVALIVAGVAFMMIRLFDINIDFGGIFNKDSEQSQSFPAAPDKNGDNGGAENDAPDKGGTEDSDDDIAAIDDTDDNPAESAYPEASYSATGAISDDIVKYAYQNEELSYIIIDVSQSGDCTQLAVRARTEADNVRDPESTMMVYDRDFWTNYFTLSDFKFDTADGEAHVTFDLRNTSDGEFSSMLLYAEFIDENGDVTATDYDYISQLGKTEKIKIDICHFYEDGENKAVAFRLYGASYTYTEGDTQTNSNWSFD